MSLPKQLQYSGVKPMGYPNKMTINRFQPQGNLQNFSINNVIRFVINNDQQFWDPYSAYLQFDLDFEGMEDGNVLQLDGSAHSLIRTMIIKTGSTELERIEDYDVLAQVLNDMHYGVEKRAQILAQGCGYNQCGYFANHGQKVKRQMTVQSRIHAGLGPQQQGMDRFQKRGGAQDFQSITSEADPQILQDYENFTDGYYGPLMLQAQHPGLLTPNPDPGWGIRVPNYALYNTQNHLLCREVPESTDLSTASWNEGIQAGFQFGDKGWQTIVDSENQPLVKGQRVEQDLMSNNFMMSPGTVGSDGYSEIEYSHSFAGTCYEPRFSKTYEQNVIINGVPTKKTITKASFCVPILSSILGILMPRKSYKLIPMAALKDLVIEIQLNPYAFFSSGFPTAQTPQTSLDTVQPFRRDGWSVSKCEIVCELVEFSDTVTSAVKAQLQQGIVFHSCGWSKGPTFSYQSFESPQGSLQINQGFESLKSVVLTMHPLDYQIYPYCRKSFRICHNITYLQLKVGMKYYPSLAVQGHCGNNHIDPDNPSKLNNTEFMINLDKAFGKYVDLVGDQFVSISNMALNERGFDPTNTDSWKDQNGDIQNIDTANGAPAYHENRVVGKAMLGLDLESLSHDYDTISGLSTIQKTPFDVILKSDNLNTFSRRSELHVWMFYDQLVKLTLGDNEVLGRV